MLLNEIIDLELVKLEWQTENETGNQDKDKNEFKQTIISTFERKKIYV